MKHKPSSPTEARVWHLSHGRLLSVVSVTLLLTCATPAQAATKIKTCPFVIRTAGVYQVAQDLTYAGTAITILADKVDLDLAGHTLTGDGSGHGVSVQAGRNVSIRRGTIEKFWNGIYLWGTLDNTLRDLTLRGHLGGGGIRGDDAVGTTVMHNTACGNYTGIEFSGGSHDNLVAHNDASQNQAHGIVLSWGAFANTVTDNTANQNFDCGIYLASSSANTVARNTTLENYCGISLQWESHWNMVERNVAAANGGEGIRLFVGPAWNTVRNNTVTGNVYGIRLFLVGAGASRNLIENNAAMENGYGIAVELGSTYNSIRDNTVLGSFLVDLQDGNPGCDSNAWADNEFVTDFVEGLGDDGGPEAGCIR